MAYKILDKALQGNATTLRSAPCFSKPTPPPNISRLPGLSPQACSSSPPSSPGREGARLKSQQVSLPRLFSWGKRQMQVPPATPSLLLVGVGDEGGVPATPSGPPGLVV